MFTGLVDYDPPREVPQIASDFYSHPYGGIARDIFVTKEGFARFFGVTEWDVDNMAVNCKWFDIMEPMTECLGYKLMRYPRNFKKGALIVEYRVTIIDHSHSRVSDLLKIAPYLWEGKHEDAHSKN